MKMSKKTRKDALKAVKSLAKSEGKKNYCLDCAIGYDGKECPKCELTFRQWLEREKEDWEKTRKETKMEKRVKKGLEKDGLGDLWKRLTDILEALKERVKIGDSIGTEVHVVTADGHSLSRNFCPKENETKEEAAKRMGKELFKEIKSDYPQCIYIISECWYTKYDKKEEMARIKSGNRQIPRPSEDDRKREALIVNLSYLNKRGFSNVCMKSDMVRKGEKGEMVEFKRNELIGNVGDESKSGIENILIENIIDGYITEGVFYYKTGKWREGKGEQEKESRGRKIF